MRADQMRFYNRFCKCKITAFILHFCASGCKNILVPTVGLGKNLLECSHGNKRNMTRNNRNTQGGAKTNQPDPMVLIMQMRREMEMEMLKKINEEEIQEMKRKNEEEIIFG